MKLLITKMESCDTVEMFFSFLKKVGNSALLRGDGNLRLQLPLISKPEQQVGGALVPEITL